MHTLTEAELLTCIRAATQAPSIHNTQPWLFGPAPDRIEVYTDPSRLLPVIDSQGRAMRISLGAAILNLRIALAYIGRAPHVELLPVPGDPRHVATVRTGGRHEAGADDRALYVAIERRRTNRSPFEDVTPPEADLTALRTAARVEGAALHLADPEERNALLSLARSADVRLRKDPAYRSELRIWTTDDPYRDDGVPLDAVGPWSALGALPIRDFALERDVPGRSAVNFERAPMLATIATAGDGVLQWLLAGQALQRVLLEATRRGLATSLFTQPLEDPGLRDLLRRRDDFTTVQAVLRIGYGPPTPASPRRPPDEVIVTPDHRIPLRPPRLS